jgi:Uma2 family endonuclease
MEPEGYFLPRFVRVVIEIADGTLNFNLTTKAVLYAQAQIPYYWVYDVEQGNLLVHEEPGEIGYNRVTQYQESDTMAPVGANGTFTVSEILPRMKEQSV